MKLKKGTVVSQTEESGKVEYEGYHSDIGLSVYRQPTSKLWYVIHTGSGRYLMSLRTLKDCRKALDMLQMYSDRHSAISIFLWGTKRLTALGDDLKNALKDIRTKVEIEGFKTLSQGDL